MELEHSFTVPVPKERAWDVLLDVEKIAPCMPGATLDSVDGDEIRGKIKVKVGPISMTYAGTAKIVERDVEAGVVRLDASGKETRGAGTASASVRSVLEDHGQETRVTVLTTLNVTGKPAQFGRGVMNEVSSKLLTIFASNLAIMLAQPDSAEAGAAEPDSTAAQPAPERDARLDDLELPARALASLHRQGITTVHQLAEKTGDELLSIDGIGPASVEDIKAKLAGHGLTLGQPAEPAELAGSPATTTSPAASSGPVAGAGAGASAAAGPAAKSGAHAAGSTRSGSGGIPKAAANGSRTSATAGAPADRMSSQAAAHLQDDSINLIKVAGMPVLKRSIPVLAGVTAVIIIGWRRKARRRSS